MGLILDSSIAIAAERQRYTVEQLIGKIFDTVDDQDAALSSVGLTELIHGIYRATTSEVRLRRQIFIDELLRNFTVYPYTAEAAMLAGKIDGEAQAKGLTVPFADLLIGATALSIGFAVFTVNPRHFRQIPGLSVTEF